MFSTLWVLWRYCLVHCTCMNVQCSKVLALSTIQQLFRKSWHVQQPCRTDLTLMKSVDCHESGWSEQYHAHEAHHWPFNDLLWILHCLRFHPGLDNEERDIIISPSQLSFFDLGDCIWSLGVTAAVVHNIINVSAQLQYEDVTRLLLKSWYPEQSCSKPFAFCLL